MCGVVGAVAERDIVPILIDGLRRLEYRGYDSAGVAVISNGVIERRRVEGKVAGLEKVLLNSPLVGHAGIAHTRWATHGVPSERNAHPHMVGDRVVLVHNGIIENYLELRKPLVAKGYEFQSDTDSEVVACCINEELKLTHDILTAVQKVVSKLEGAYALCVMDAKDPNRVIGVRSGCPLVVGVGLGEHFLASDALTLQRVTQQFIYLEEGDVADVKRGSLCIFDKTGQKVTRNIHTQQFRYDAADKGHYRHYMLKEIFEQSTAVRDTLEGRLSKGQILEHVFGYEAPSIFDKTERVQIVACGTSYHSGLIARYWLESIAGIPVGVEIASEFRYRKRVLEPNTLFVSISQSGETADTLAALRGIRNEGYCGTLSICNVPESSLVRESNLVFLTSAGPEVCVCSTKAFTTQLTALLLLTLVLGRRRGIEASQESKLVEQISHLPNVIQQFLTLNEKIQKLANLFNHKAHALFLGRGIQFPVVLEGALKLKEISYIHAEAYPAGELKHGPLALVDEHMPVVVVAPKDHLLDKLKSSIEEVRARGGEMIIFSDKSSGLVEGKNMHVIEMPPVDELLAPIAYTIPLQLLAYHVAVLKGTDVDQPRNLAKSVTVE